MSPAPSTSEIVSASLPELRRRMQDFLAKPARGRYLALARRVRHLAGNAHSVEAAVRCVVAGGIQRPGSRADA